MKFHLNYKGEAGKCNATVGACPFGGDEDHFSSESEARKAYENAQAAFNAPVKKTPSEVIRALNLDKASDGMLTDLKDELQTKPWGELTDDEHVAVAAITSVQEQRARQASAMASPPKQALSPDQVLEYERMADLTKGKVSPSELAEADGFDASDIDERIAGFKQDRIVAAENARARADANPNSIGDEMEAQHLEKEAGLRSHRAVAKKATASRKKPTRATLVENRTPRPENSKIIVPPAVNKPQTKPGEAREWRGGKVPDSFLSQREAAKGMRSDIREAIKMGELPDDLSYSVRMNTGAWVTSIDIAVGGKAESGRPIALSSDMQQDARVQAVVKYLDALGNQYSTDYSNPNFDDWNISNKARVRFLY